MGAKQQPKERSVEEVQKRVAVHYHSQSKIAPRTDKCLLLNSLIRFRQIWQQRPPREHRPYHKRCR